MTHPDPTLSPADYGKKLSGIGLNLLVRDIERHVTFLANTFELRVARQDSNFAIIHVDKMAILLHQDATYENHPLHTLLPETPPRGQGIEIRLYDIDPDAVCARTNPGHILAPPTDKPHGLREAYILDPDGYIWVPSRPLI